MDLKDRRQAPLHRCLQLIVISFIFKNVAKWMFSFGLSDYSFFWEDQAKECKGASTFPLLAQPNLLFSPLMGEKMEAASSVGKIDVWRDWGHTYLLKSARYFFLMTKIKLINIAVRVEVSQRFPFLSWKLVNVFSLALSSVLQVYPSFGDFIWLSLSSSGLLLEILYCIWQLLEYLLLYLPERIKVHVPTSSVVGYLQDPHSVFQ